MAAHCKSGIRAGEMQASFLRKFQGRSARAPRSERAHACWTEATPRDDRCVLEEGSNSTHPSERKRNRYKIWHWSTAELCNRRLNDVSAHQQQDGEDVARVDPLRPKTFGRAGKGIAVGHDKLKQSIGIPQAVGKDIRLA